MLLALEGEALRPLVVVLAAEYLVLPQLALQRSVVEGNACGGLEADVVEAFLLIAQHPRLAVLELVLQPLANHAVEPHEVGRRDALAVGRVHDDDALLGGLREVLEVAEFDAHFLRHAGRLDVARGHGHRLAVVVVAVDLVLELALLAVVVVYLGEEVGVEVGPLLEGVSLAVDARRYVAGYEGRLDGQRAAAAHGVDEVALSVPSRREDDAGCQHLVEGRGHRLLAVSAAVQALAAAVQRQRAVGLRHVDVQPQVGVGDAYVGALARALAELVHDGVLDPVGHILGVSELRTVYHVVHGERRVQRQILAPVHGLDGLVDLVGARRLEAFDGLEYPHCGAQRKVGAVHHLLVPREAHHASADGYVVGSQACQFLCQHRFQSLKCLGNHLELTHLFSLLNKLS